MERYVTSRATLADQAAIEELLARADRLVMYTDWGTVRRAPRDQAVYLVQADDRLVCACGLFTGPETVAQIRVFGLLEGWPLSHVVAALLPLAREQLGAQGVTTLAFIGIEAWLIAGLSANGFRHVNTILTLQKTDFAIPDTGSSDVTLRPAQKADFPGIMAIDQAAFVPLWRNTESTLSEYTSTCQRFEVAVLGEVVVGYQCLSLIGRHGHVTRIAVHPDYQGQHIAVRLLAQAVGFFRDHRVFGITLNTQQDNLRARRLYEWFGFRVLGKEAQVMALDMTLACLSENRYNDRRT